MFHADWSPFPLNPSVLSNFEGEVKGLRSQVSENRAFGYGEKKKKKPPWIWKPGGRKSKVTVVERKTIILSRKNFKRRRKKQCDWGWICWIVPAWRGRFRCRDVSRYQNPLLYILLWYGVNNLGFLEKTGHESHCKRRGEVNLYKKRMLGPSVFNSSFALPFPSLAITNYQLVFRVMALLSDDIGKYEPVEIEISSPYHKSRKGQKNLETILAEGLRIPNDAKDTINANLGGYLVVHARSSIVPVVSGSSKIHLVPHDANIGSSVNDSPASSPHLADDDVECTYRFCKSVFEYSSLCKLKRVSINPLLSLGVRLLVRCYHAVSVDLLHSSSVAPCASFAVMRKSEQQDERSSSMTGSSNCIGLLILDFSIPLQPSRRHR